MRRITRKPISRQVDQTCIHRSASDLHARFDTGQCEKAEVGSGKADSLKYHEALKSKVCREKVKHYI